MIYSISGQDSADTWNQLRQKKNETSSCQDDGDCSFRNASVFLFLNSCSGFLLQHTCRVIECDDVFQIELQGQFLELYTWFSGHEVTMCTFNSTKHPPWFSVDDSNMLQFICNHFNSQSWHITLLQQFPETESRNICFLLTCEILRATIHVLTF